MKILAPLGLLALLLLATGCHRDPALPESSPTPAASASATQNAPSAATKYRRFIHVSELYKEGVSERFGRALSVARTASDGTLVSLDQNESPEELEALVLALGDKRVDFCLYVDGPGGPTGENGEYDPDELMRIVERARHYVKAPVTDPRNRFIRADGRPSPRLEDYQDYTVEHLDHLPWMKEWNSTGWPLYFKEQTLPQLRGTKPFTEGLTLSFRAAEIDNLYRHLAASGHTFGQFLEDYQAWVGEPSLGGTLNSQVMLILKNLNHDDESLQMVKGALAFAEHHGNSLFAGIHVAEAERDDFPGRAELDAHLAKLGVVTVVSLDTTDYVASTFPGHRRELNDPQTLLRLEQTAAQNRLDSGSEETPH